MIFKKLSLLLCIVLLLQQNAFAQKSDTLYFTNGFKVGEVTVNSVLVWTRLCAQKAPVPVCHERKDPKIRTPLDFDESMPVEEMDGAVKGAFGQVRIQLTTGSNTVTTEWEYVSAYRDFTLKKRMDGLSPNTLYKIRIQARRESGSPVTEIRGHFRTAPLASEAFPVTFTSSSCQYFWDFDDPERGFKIYDAMIKLQPDFHCHTGDYVYYDKPGPMADNVELARHKWHANNAWPSVREFYALTPIYQQKDDHDMMFNDASPNMEAFGELGFQDGLSVWNEQVPVEGKPYRTFRWGKDLQIWLVEGREFRSDNWVPDGPHKTIWGMEQKEWFVETVRNSDATFKILVSPTPVVGPDRSQGKNDNHANKAFETEGRWLRSFLGEHSVFVVNGDRHWQYLSKDAETGVLEFSQGPSSDSHAQGWRQEDRRPEHQFLRVQGGFLAVEVYRKENQPHISFTHRDVNGLIVHELTLTNKIE
ncbi:MAG: alkaline phosphatase D family protein [Bacteroidota bacterium]|nr:alkaline phosphatase D family protein [Bacteroidota bacterium]